MGTVTKLQISNLCLSQVGARRITTFGETTTAEGRAINAVYEFVRDKVLEEHPWTFAQKRVALVDMTRSAQDDWVTATAYVVDDIVYDPTNAKYYKCLVAHTSVALFSTDLAAANWELYTNWVTATVYAPDTNVYNLGIEYACLVQHAADTLFATDLTALKWVATELVVDMDDFLTNVFYLPTDYLKVNLLSDKVARWQVVEKRFFADDSTMKIGYTYRNDDPLLYSAQFVTALATRLAAEICFELTESTRKAELLLEKYEKIDLPRATSVSSQQGTPEELQQDEWLNERLR